MALALPPISISSSASSRTGGGTVGVTQGASVTFPAPPSPFTAQGGAPGWAWAVVGVLGLGVIVALLAFFKRKKK